MVNCKKSVIVFSLLSSFLSVSSYAGSSENDLAANLHNLYPKTPITSVKQTPIKGVFEVVMGKNIGYTDLSGRYFLFGHLFDMSTQTDLTASEIKNINKVNFADLPFAKAIKITKGDGSRKFAVFSDPSCPYCKQLESTLDGMTNYTMYVFLYPIEEIHPGTTAKAVSIWCAADPAKTWDATTVQNKTPANATCPNPVADLHELGVKMGINGTPTLIRPDGVVAPGAAPAEQLEKFLSGK